MPQPGIFALGTRSHPHREFELTGDPRDVLPAVHRIREAANTIAGVKGVEDHLSVVPPVSYVF